MNMKLISCISLIFVLYVSSASSMSNTTFDSMKIGVSHFNKAGNDFFDLIRGRIDPDTVQINDYIDANSSMKQLMKGANNYLSYSILLTIGVTFAVFVPIVGLFVMCCRCCGKCGGKKKAMDPKYAKCKRISYGIVLLVLAIGMVFGTIISLFNNQIVHEIVVNEDKSVNIFLGLESNLQRIQRSLIEIKDSINNSEPVTIDEQHLQGLSNDLDDNIKQFYSRLVKVPEFLHVIEQTESLKTVLARGDVDKYQQILTNFNGKLANLSTHLEGSKTKILGHLSGCLTPECNAARDKTERLKLRLLNQTIVDSINKTLDQIKSDSLKNTLSMIMNMKENNTVNMKLILDSELKEIKDKIRDKRLMQSVKSAMVDSIDHILLYKQEIETIMPSVAANETRKHEYYKMVKTFENYRFIGYLCACGIVLLITLCYLLGLLYGLVGERATEDAGCCNRAVGARFLLSGVILTFLLSSFLMIGVITNMMATGVPRTEICRYAAMENENNVKVLDLYVDVAMKLSNRSNTMRGVMDGLFNKCSNQNFYSALSEVNQKLIIKSLKNYFKNIDEKIVSIVLSQINLTSFLTSSPFQTTTSIDLSHFVHLISLMKTEGEFTEYINELMRLQSTAGDSDEMRSLNVDVINLRTSFGLVVQYLNNSENSFMQLKSVAEVFEPRKLEIIKSQTPQLVSAIQKSLFKVLDLVFSTMFKDVSCKNLRLEAIGLFRTVCNDTINPLNGTWYGIGFALILMIPALIFALVLTGLYRRLQKFYPDKDEPDYENYIGFYARADNDALKNNNDKKVAAHRGYRPIPLQPVS